MARLLPPESAGVKDVAAAVGVSADTLERWRSEALASGKKSGGWTAVARFEAVLATASMSGAQKAVWCRIVPMLADEGRYLASESSFHRVLRANGQMQHCGRAKAPQASRTPTHSPGRGLVLGHHVVARLPSSVTGRWCYLYLILDLYSRKIVGHEVHAVESGEHAAQLLKRTALAEGESWPW